ncbi:hypothetical protein D3C83_20530 [compost metagenome]
MQNAIGDYRDIAQVTEKIRDTVIDGMRDHGLVNLAHRIEYCLVHELVEAKDRTIQAFQRAARISSPGSRTTTCQPQQYHQGKAAGQIRDHGNNAPLARLPF